MCRPRIDTYFPLRSCVLQLPQNFRTELWGAFVVPVSTPSVQAGGSESISCLKVLLPLAREMHVGSLVGLGGPSQDGLVGDVANYPTPSRWPVGCRAGT